MNRKYLPLYYRWMKSGTLPENGLCNFFANPTDPDNLNVKDEYPEFSLMIPNRPDLIKNGGFWGTELKADRREYNFCELRQTIVLLMAAMNNEL